MNARYIVLVLSLFMLNTVSFSAWAVEDEQLWLSADVKLHQKDKSTFFFYMETRSNDYGSTLQQYFFGPRYQYRMTDQWSLGTALKSIHIKSDGDYFDLYRLEAEAIYTDSFGGSGKLDFRNRLEYLYENKAETIYRYRPRLRYRLPLSKHHIGGRYFSQLFFSQELIYSNINHDWQLAQSRFIPLGLSIKTGARSALSLFYLYNTKIRLDRDNDTLHVLGVSFSY